MSEPPVWCCSTVGSSKLQRAPIRQEDVRVNSLDINAQGDVVDRT